MSTPAAAVYNPGGEIVVGTPVIAKPAYPKQSAPPSVLFAQPVAPAAQGGAGATYFYAQPQGFQPSPFAAAVATAVPVASGVPVAQGPLASAMPIAQGTLASAVPIAQGTPAAAGPAQPRGEVTASFTNGDLRSTGQARYGGDPSAVSHANFYWNDIARIEGLGRFPNLLRLTLSGNHLTNVVGLEACPHLRWLDVSVNDLTSFSGAQHVGSLEWLDAHSNELRSLDGLGFAPNLTWLNVSNSNLASLRGLRSLPNLRVLDASRNELGTTNGVGKCAQLIELRVQVNNLTDLAEVHQLGQLRALDVSSNELDNLPAELRGCAALHSLSVAHNNLGSRNVRELVGAFSGHGSLRALAVGSNAFSPADLQQLRSALAPGGCVVDASKNAFAEAQPSGESGACSCEVM